MAEKGRDEFKRGMAIAIKEWKEAEILQGDRTASLLSIAKGDIEDCHLRLQSHEQPETQISLSIVQRLTNLIQMDGPGKRTKGSVGIDLLSDDWLNSSTESFYHLTNTHRLCQS